jgi:hypothetical protein
MDEALAATVDLRGHRRFWPPGQHPAIRRHVAQLARLRALGADEHSDAVVYVQRAIAAFEECETEAKYLYLTRYLPPSS